MKNPMEHNFAINNSLTGPKKNNNLDIIERGFIRIGFDEVDAGLGSKEDVVNYLDQKQLEWEKRNPGFKAGEISDKIIPFTHIGIGSDYFCGYRYFKKIPITNSVK